MQAGGGVARRAQVLATYKRLIRYAGRLRDEGERASALERIRREFRTHSTVMDDAAVTALIADAQKRLAYLRIVTPRHAHDDAADGGGVGSGGGVKRFVLVDGKLVDAEEAAALGAGRGAVKVGGLDPADVKRHMDGMARFRFGKHSARPKGPLG
jgi:hypothetical protein